MEFLRGGPGPERWKSDPPLDISARPQTAEVAKISAYSAFAFAFSATNRGKKSICHAATVIMTFFFATSKTDLIERERAPLHIPTLRRSLNQMITHARSLLQNAPRTKKSHFLLLASARV